MTALLLYALTIGLITAFSLYMLGISICRPAEDAAWSLTTAGLAAIYDDFDANDQTPDEWRDSVPYEDADQRLGGHDNPYDQCEPDAGVARVYPTEGV